jgi:hypothetical protein
MSKFSVGDRVRVRRDSSLVGIDGLDEFPLIVSSILSGNRTYPYVCHHLVAEKEEELWV